MLDNKYNFEVKNMKFASAFYSLLPSFLDEEWVTY